ncbi:kinase-like domain-containing protein [Sporodiniella umbellata]|nr:kinase-like domain-containing protein [Sporodiniella umbellata]
MTAIHTEVDDPSHPLHHHRRIVTDFEYGDILGEGSYSTVLVGRDKRSGKLYAVKRLDKAHIVKNNKVKYVMIERDALSKMNHPGIVKLYWTFKDNRSLYFVLDLAKSGELYTCIRRLAPFDLRTTQFYTAEILLAVEHIHNQGVVHRDIKPENILLDDNMHIKITDFGSAKILTDQSISEEENAAGSRSFVGTAEYVSPELLSGEPVSKEADYWALGCVVYQMLTGKSPFKAATDYLIFQKIKTLEYSIPSDFPPIAKDFVQKLLISDPSKRLGAEGGIDSIKAHSFFDGIDWDTIFESNAPAIKERLAEDLRRNPPPPQFDFEHPVDDTWFHHPVAEDPFSDHLIAERRMDSYPSSISSSAKPNTQSINHSQQSSYTHFSSSAGIKEDKNVGMERLGEKSHPLWIPHLYPNESIIKSGRVIRRRGLFSRKRNLILTNRPRLLYLDQGSEKDKLDGNLRCEIPWTSHLLPELKGRSLFCIHTPEKSYTFEDRKHAQEWVNTINVMLVDSFGVSS